MIININNTSNLTKNDLLLCITHLFYKQYGFVKFINDSMNDYYEIAIEKIVTEIFKIKLSIQNERKKTEEDRQIKKIDIEVKFSNVTMKPPVSSAYSSGHEKIQLPLQAHLSNKSYNASGYVDVEIDANATKHDGSIINKNCKIYNHRLLDIPAAIGSNVCNIKDLSKNALNLAHIDKENLLGTLITKGNDYAVPSKESIKFNQARIFNNKWSNELSRLECISKPGDTYENSKQIIIRLFKNNNLTIELVTPILKEIQFPFLSYVSAS